MSDSMADLQLALEMALQLGQFQAGFLSRVAHELRSPMGSLMSLQQLILNDLCEDPAEEREFIRQSYSYAQKLMGLLDQAIDVSKLDYGTLKIKRDQIILKQLIDELERLVGLQSKNRNLKLILPQDNLSTVFVCDRLRLRQVLVILLDQIIAHQTIGKITLEFAIVGDRLCFSLTSQTPADLWIGEQKIFSLPETINSETIKKLAQSLEFSPALKWQLCDKTITAIGGTLTLNSIEESITQTQCWLPLIDKPDLPSSDLD